MMRFKLCVLLRQSPTAINFDFDTREKAQRVMDNLHEKIKAANDANAEQPDEWATVLDDVGRFLRILIEEIGGVLFVDAEQATRAAIEDQRMQARMATPAGGLAVPMGAPVLGLRQ